MKRVPGHRHLFLRGRKFIFRRSVPEFARQEFRGRGEVHVSLGDNIADARYALARESAKFDAALRRAGHHSGSSKGALRIPSNVEIDEAVREWLLQRLDRAMAGSIAKPRRPRQTDVQLADLEQISFEATQNLRNPNNGPGKTAEWIAEAVAADNLWDIEPDSSVYQYLVRMVARGQREASTRQQQEIEGLPLKVDDETFSPENYRLDIERQRDRSSKQSVSIYAMLDAYSRERQPRPSTIRAWRRQIDKFVAFAGTDNVKDVDADMVNMWKNELSEMTTGDGKPLTARTINDTYLSALKTVLGWAKDNLVIAVNPALGIRVRAPKKQRLHDASFTDDQAMLILKATLGEPPKRLTKERAFARRWVPWICAYSGARVNEITQRRRQDIFEVEGIPVMNITPDAGTVKGGIARLVPLHPHLIEQDFLGAIRDKVGPLFYDPTRRVMGSDENPQPKKVGEHLAIWVREIGILEPELQPNHAWRHRFKTLARKHRMDVEARDAIQGHAGRTEGEKYGGAPIEWLYEEIQRLPRYAIERLET